MMMFFPLYQHNFGLLNTKNYIMKKTIIIIHIIFFYLISYSQNAGTTCTADAGADITFCGPGNITLNAIGYAPQTHSILHTVAPGSNGTIGVFTPTNITVRVGDEVKFTGIHNAIINGSTTSFPTNPSSFGHNSGVGNISYCSYSGISIGYSYVFNTPGNYQYQCDNHPGTIGSITVVAANNAYCVWHNINNPANFMIGNSVSYYSDTNAIETFVLTIIDSANNCIDHDTINVTSSNAKSLINGINLSSVNSSSWGGSLDTTVCMGDSVILTASFSGGHSPYSFHWIPYGGTGSVINPSQVLVNTSNPYGHHQSAWLLHWVDSMGCDGMDTVNVYANTATTSTITQSGVDSVVINGQAYYQTGTYTQTLTNAAGCDSIITINASINSSAGVNDFQSINLNTYPNPTNGIINIKGLEKIGTVNAIIILNNEGKTMKNFSVNLREINISDLQDGMYFLCINHNQGKEFIRVIKK